MAERNRKIVVNAALAAVGITVAVVVFRAYDKAKRRKPRVDGILLDWDMSPKQIKQSAQDIIRRCAE